MSRPDLTIMLESAIGMTKGIDFLELVGLYDKAMEIPSEKDRNAAFSSIADNIWGAIMDKQNLSRREYPKMLASTAKYRVHHSLLRARVTELTIFFQWLTKMTKVEFV